MKRNTLKKLAAAVLAGAFIVSAPLSLTKADAAETQRLDISRIEDHPYGADITGFISEGESVAYKLSLKDFSRISIKGSVDADYDGFDIDLYDRLGRFIERVDYDDLQMNYITGRNEISFTSDVIRKGTVYVVVSDRKDEDLNCFLKIRIDPAPLTVKDRYVTLKKGASLRLKVYDQKKKAASLKYKSSNKKTVAVSKNGRVRGVRKGVSYISVTDRYGRKASFVVKVK